MKTTALLLTAITATAASAGTNLALNGGFELGTGADSDFWTEFGGPGSFRSSDAPLAGDWSHELNAVGSDTAGAAAGINYNSASDGGLASLAENSVVNLTFDADTNFGPGGVGFYALRILNADGAIVADTGLQNLAASGLNSYDISLNVPAFGMSPNDSYAAFVEIVTNAGAFDGSFANAKIDNVVITGTLVPTPAGVALLGMGGLVATRRRR